MMERDSKGQRDGMGERKTGARGKQLASSGIGNACLGLEPWTLGPWMDGNLAMSMGGSRVGDSGIQ